MYCVQKSVFPTPAPAPRRYVSPHRRPKVHLVSVGLHQGMPHSTGWRAAARRSATVKMPSGLNSSALKKAFVIALPSPAIKALRASLWPCISPMWTLPGGRTAAARSEEHTSELQSLMRISYAVFCLKKKKYNIYINTHNCQHN